MASSQIRFRHGAERNRIFDMLVQEIEFELGADRVVEKDLIARVLDILFLELDVELFQALAEFHRTRSLERYVIHAPVVLVLDERIFREPGSYVDDGIVAVIEPDSGEHEVGAVTGLQAKHIAVKFLDRGKIALRAADVEMQKS